MPKKVRAVREGYYGRRRRPGIFPECIFYIGDDERLGSWMELVADGEKAPEEVTEEARLNELNPSTVERAPEDPDRGVPAYQPGTVEARIVDALFEMDHYDDELWNADGSPDMELIQGLVGDINVGPEDVQRAWPGFRRGILPDDSEEELAPIGTAGSSS